MAISKYLLITFIGFTFLQAADIEPKGCSSNKKETNTQSSKSSYSNDNFEEDEIVPELKFHTKTDVINYLSTTFKNINSEVTLEGRGPYAYVGDIMVGTIEIVGFDSKKAVIKWGPYPFIVDLDCDCMINDAGGVYKPLY